jgi:hypothetical protein
MDNCPQCDETGNFPMFDQIMNAPWWQLADFLTKGNPPLVVELMLVNTIFLIVVIIRRAKGLPTMRTEAVIQIQGLVILANAMVLFQDQIIRGLDVIM